jgi:polar amino acid transport system substrate-binding protein
MKKFSKTLFVTLLVSVLLLSACGTQNSNETNATAVSSSSSTSKPEGCLGDASKMVADLNCRKVTIALENAYLPFNYILVSSNQPGGWDYDAWNEICARLNCTPVFSETPWDSLVQQVADGQFDVGANGVTITDERKQQVDFSDPYKTVQQMLLVRKGETRINSIEDIVNDTSLKLGTQISTTNYIAAAKFLPEDRIQGFEQFPFAIQALLSGDLDAVIIDEISGSGYIAQDPDHLQFAAEAITSDEQLGFLFPKGSDLVAPVNQALAAMKADGTLEKLDEKFFTANFALTNDQIQ